MKNHTALEKIYKELSERFKDEPNKGLILGYTMGAIEKYKSEIINDELIMLKSTLLDCPYDFTSRCIMGRCDCKPKTN